MSLPRVHFTIDGAPIPLDEWSLSSTTGIGYDQARAIASGRKARSFAHQVDQGSILKAYTETGSLIFEGQLPQPPKFTQDGLVSFAAQGYGYQAAKYGDRLTAIMSSPGAWVPANQAPLNFSSQSAFGTFGVTFVNSVEARHMDTEGSPGNDLAIAFAAPGMALSRLVFTRRTNQTTAAELRVYSATFPDIQRTKRIEFVDDSLTTGAPEDYDITFANPGDVIVIQIDKTTGNVTNTRFDNPRVWGDYALDSLYSEHAARIVANRLGWDDIGVTGKGGAPHYALDWAGDAAGFLSYVCSLEDWCWGAWEDAGSGPVLKVGPYGHRHWNVSAATGATWNLDPLERYKRIVVQFLNVDNSLNYVTLEAPDTFNIPEGVNTELRGSLADAQSSDGLAFALAWRRLRRALDERYRGQISFARARDAETGREATYEVRAGDLITITDFTFDGSITLRVHDVQLSPSGVTVGVEAMALPLGPLGAGSGGGVQTSNVQLASSTQGTAAYIPTGAPGGSASTRAPLNTGTPLDDIFPGGVGWGPGY